MKNSVRISALLVLIDGMDAPIAKVMELLAQNASNHTYLVTQTLTYLAIRVVIILITAKDV